MIALFAGSFDPPTLGHLDIIERAARLFDTLIVLAADNSAKTTQFTGTQKASWLKEACAHLDNVQVVCASGLTIEQARRFHADVLIRSLRNGQDYDMEANIAWMNSMLEGGMETLFLCARPEHAFISSSNVRELLRYDQSIEALVPQTVFQSLQPHLARQAKTSNSSTESRRIHDANLD